MKITQVKRDLESSETLAHGLEMLRVLRQLAAKLTNAEGIVRRKPHAFNSEKRLSKSDCTNRTSLRKPFYATKYSTYTSTSRNYQKVREGYGRPQNGIEAYRNIWKSLENARTVHR